MYFKLFSNCIIVEGSNFDAIYDLHFGNILKINKRISNLLKEDLSQHTIDDVKSKHPDWEDGLEAYMNLFIEKNLAFKTSEPHKFPPLDLTYRSPFKLDNAIVEVNKELDDQDAIRQIIDLNVYGFQIILDTPKLEELQKYIDLFFDSRIKRVEFLIRQSELTFSQLKTLNDDIRFVYRSYNATEDQSQGLKSLDTEDIAHAHYFFTNDGLDILKKERYGMGLFSLNINHFIEAKSRNVGLNKKVCIDKKGNIKNYINHESSFGNIKKDKIADVVAKEDFQKKWFIDNSQIEKCNVCINRMMCYSCSDITEVEGKYYKTDDCNYNPSTDNWEA